MAHDQRHDLSEHPDDGYEGTATLVLDGGEERPVDVTLRGHFQPIDGRYHWYGRIAADERLAALLGGKRGEALIRTPHGEAHGELSDPDPWNRYRIHGTSTPPFAVDRTLPAD